MVRMRSIMETILLDIMFDLPGLEGVEKVVISRQVVEGISPPLYIYADVPLRVGDADASA
jgi:ATP-dependent Clp protease ATP-binding subunit ClpX